MMTCLYMALGGWQGLSTYIILSLTGPIEIDRRECNLLFMVDEGEIQRV